MTSYGVIDNIIGDIVRADNQNESRDSGKAQKGQDTPGGGMGESNPRPTVCKTVVTEGKKLSIAVKYEIISLSRYPLE